MIPRYTMPEMAAVFSDPARFGRYLEIELLATEAHVALGIVPAADGAACRDRAPLTDDAFVQAVSDREVVTDHEVPSACRRLPGSTTV
jgi:adenylosuccinate lyase